MISYLALALAQELLATVIAAPKDDKERVQITVIAAGYLLSVGQVAESERLLKSLLAEPELARRADLWRLASEVAEKRDMSARAMVCLERALELESQDVPDVVDLEAVRRDYGKVLEHYQGLADALVSLETPPPPEFGRRS